MTSLINKLSLMSVLSIFAILMSICSVQSSVFAEKLNLDEMSIDLPSRMDMQYHYAPSGNKIFDIVDKRTNTIFGTIAFVNFNTDPTAFDKEVDYLKQITFNYQELKPGCDDGFLSIETSFCTVAYYAEMQRGNGFYAMKLDTQVKEGISALWSFVDYDGENLIENIQTIKNIVNTMEPIYHSNEEDGRDNSSFDSNSMQLYDSNEGNDGSNSDGIPFEDYSVV